MHKYTTIPFPHPQLITEDPVEMIMTMKVVPSGQIIGAEVLGLDLSRHIDDATFTELEWQFYDRSVLCLRNQSLEQQPAVIHPVVRVHPHTGRKYLFVNRGECQGIVGMDEAEGQALIHELADAIPRPAYRYEHYWQVGDLLIWDNRAVQHVANFNYQWPKHRRLMHRVTISEPMA